MESRAALERRLQAASRKHQIPKRRAEARRKPLGPHPFKPHYGGPKPAGGSFASVAEHEARAGLPCVIREDGRIPLVLFHAIGRRHGLDWAALRVRHLHKLLHQDALSPA